jgi:hypothetical protein
MAQSYCRLKMLVLMQLCVHIHFTELLLLGTSPPCTSAGAWLRQESCQGLSRSGVLDEQGVSEAFQTQVRREEGNRISDAGPFFKNI